MPPQDFVRQYQARTGSMDRKSGMDIRDSKGDEKIYSDFADAMARVLELEETKRRFGPQTPMGQPGYAPDLKFGPVIMDDRANPMGFGNELKSTMPDPHTGLRVPILKKPEGMANPNLRAAAEALINAPMDEGTLFGKQQFLNMPSFFEDEQAPPAVPTPPPVRSVAPPEGAQVPQFPGAAPPPPSPMNLPDLRMRDHMSPGIGEQSLDSLNAMTDPNVDATFQNPMEEAREVAVAEMANELTEEEAEPGYWTQFFSAMASGITPALVAWAAEKFQAPTIYQAYAQQKANELAEARQKAEMEIEQAKLDADNERARQAALDRERDYQLSLLGHQRDLMADARAFNQSEIGDAQEWSQTMTGLALHAQALKMDPQVFIETHPFPKVRQLQRMVDVLEEHIERSKGDPGAMMMANIPNLISPEGGFISGLELARQVGMIDLRTGFVNMPLGLTGTADVETVDPDGTRRVTQVTPFERGLYGTQVQHKTPSDPLGVELKEMGRLPDGTVIWGKIDKERGDLVGFLQTPGGTPDIPEDPFAALGGGSEYERKMASARDSIGNYLQQKGLSPEQAARLMNENLTPLHLIHFANNPTMGIEELFEPGFMPKTTVGGGF